MRIVLDTTSIRADYHLSSPTSRTFLTGLSLIPARLYVPEVVIDEVVNGYRQDLQKAARDFDGARRTLARLLAGPVDPGHVVSIEDRAADYRAGLIERISEVGGEVLPYPRVAHKTLVQRDLSKRKPFKESGSGYRDALIWESVRSQTWGGDERIVFVSGNSADFGDGPLVHEDLRSDIRNPERVTLVRSLRELNEKLILPKTQMLEDLRRQLEAHVPVPVDLAGWLKRRLLSLLQDENDTIVQVVAGFPPDVGSAWPSEIVELKDLRVVYVRELAGDELIVRLEVRADVSVSIGWDREDALRSAEVRAWNGDDLGFTTASASVLEELRVGLDLIVDRRRGDVVSEEVGMLATPACSVDYGSWGIEDCKTTSPGAP